MASSFIQTYANAVSHQLDFLPTWPLDYDVKLGDVGVLEGSVFRRTDTLKRLGIGEFEVRTGHGETVLEFTSKEGRRGCNRRRRGFGHGGNGLLRLKLSLVEKVAFFLRVGDHSIQQIESTDALAEEIIERFKRGEWQRRRVVRDRDRQRVFGHRAGVRKCGGPAHVSSSMPISPSRPR